MIIFKLKKIMLTALLVYSTLLLILFLAQRRIQYLPTGKILTLDAYKLSDFSEQTITTIDGVKIFAWFKDRREKNRKIIFYLHGNGGSLGDRAYRYRKFADKGYGVLAISYRGYKKSEGSPSEKGLILDAKAGLDFLLKKGFVNDDIIIYGESLGSGVATQLAANQDFNLLILESPYSSIVSVASKTYWYVPLRFLLKDKFESVKYSPKIKTPTIIFHGKKDSVVSFKEGKKLFESIKAVKDFILDENLGHVEFDPSFVLEEITNFQKN